MAHKFIEATEIPKKAYEKNRNVKDALLKIAEVLSPGKAVLIDLAKFGKGPHTISRHLKEMIMNGELAGLVVTTRNKGQDVYLERS